ncbi:ATP-binding cassette domain-containing protein [Mariniblastus sp.]|nr:ATP-binding cassette domain-containing protein [Mariniblastus sp.]
MSSVVLDHLSKRYPGGSMAVDRVSLEVRDQEFLVLVGPSGCGKSTTLRLIAGLESVTDGKVLIGDRVVNDVAPRERDIAMVFQNYALYPHMSVYRNMSFGLTLRFGGGVLARGLRKVFQPRRAADLSAKRAGIDHQVRQAASRLSIEHLLDRKPHQLSGGERQRVALGRAIVRNPAVFLLDEPLSNLDANLRQQMRVELKRLHRQLQATMIYVTHDQVEALTLGDRVAVMNGGRIQQVGRPLEIFQQPANLFVARFVGSVPMNLRRGTVSLEGQQIVFDDGCLKMSVDLAKSDAADSNANDRIGKRLSELTATERSDGIAQVIAGFRAEDVTIVPAAEGSDYQAIAEVISVDHLGDSALAHLRLQATGDGSLNLQFGQFEQNDRLVVARISPGQSVAAGDRVGVTVGPHRLTWFDPESGRNLRKEET